MTDEIERVEEDVEAGADAELDAAAPPVDSVEAPPLPEIDAEQPLRAADADADADLARPPRATQYRVQRRTQISMLIPGLLVVAVGALYFMEALTPDVEEYPRPVLIGAGAGALGLALVMRFLFNGRRERGLFITGLLVLAWTGLAALVVTGVLAVEQGWPLAIVAVGLVLIIAFFFERSHERGLILPALAFIVAGIVAMPFALGLVPSDLASLVAIFWPLLILVAALLLLPRAIRPRLE